MMRSLRSSARGNALNRCFESLGKYSQAIYLRSTTSEHLLRAFLLGAFRDARGHYPPLPYGVAPKGINESKVRKHFGWINDSNRQLSMTNGVRFSLGQIYNQVVLLLSRIRLEINAASAAALDQQKAYSPTFLFLMYKLVVLFFLLVIIISPTT